MKIVNILGGLGNQMFQYALLVGLRESFKEEVYADVTGFSNYNLHNGLELERIFPIRLKKVECKRSFLKSHTLSCYINQYLPFLAKGYQFEFPDNRYIADIYTAKQTDCYYLGYWHNYKYVAPFRTQLLSEFRFIEPLDDKNQKIADKIKLENSVGIHVRRGDYLKEKQYQGICDIDYYSSAICLLKERFVSPVFYVFSNDMEWCKEELRHYFEDNEVIYVDWNIGMSNYRDMQLMTYCKGLVIANSSFSWWGAFLNNREDGIVVSPKRWLNKKHSPEIQMPEWQKI